MKALKKILIGLVGLVVVLLIVGFLLPRTYRVERSIEINVAPEKVYPLVAEPKNWLKWGVWSRRDPNMQFEFSGAASGVGAKWSWQSKSEGNGNMELTVAEPLKLVGYRIIFPDYDMVAEGRLQFAPAGTGTRVTWIGEGDMGGNPLMHYMALMMDRMLGPDFEGGLQNMKTLVEKG